MPPGPTGVSDADELADADRRTVLKALSAGAAGAALLPQNATAQPSSVGEVVFEDEFEDGQLDWTDVDHPEFWSLQDGQVQYDPSTSAGSTGDNYLYADETFDGDEGLLEWPVALEFRGYASDTSAALGALATDGGPQDGQGDVRLGIQDGKHNDQFHVWNSEGEHFTLSGARENDTWYTYRLVPDLENNEIQITRNDESWTVPEPNDNPIGNTSIALSGGTCWGCGGTGDRRYEYIRVWNMSTSQDTPDPQADLPYTFEHRPLAASEQNAFFVLNITGNDILPGEFDAVGPVKVSTESMDARIRAVHPLPNPVDSLITSLGATLVIIAVDEARDKIPVDAPIEIINTFEEYNFEQSTTNVEAVEFFGDEGLSVQEQLAGQGPLSFLIHLESTGGAIQNWGTRNGDLRISQAYKRADTVGDSLTTELSQFFDFSTEDY